MGLIDYAGNNDEDMQVTSTDSGSPFGLKEKLEEGFKEKTGVEYEDASQETIRDAIDSTFTPISDATGGGNTDEGGTNPYEGITEDIDQLDSTGNGLIKNISGGLSSAIDNAVTSGQEGGETAVEGTSNFLSGFTGNEDPVEGLGETFRNFIDNQTQQDDQGFLDGIIPNPFAGVTKVVKWGIIGIIAFMVLNMGEK